MDRTPGLLEAQIDALSEQYAKDIDALATGDFIRGGVLRQAVCALMWELFRQFPDQRDVLSEALENWPDLIRDAIAEENGKNSADAASKKEG